MSDDPGAAEPIRLPMLLVASEPMLSLRAEGSDRSTIGLRFSKPLTTSDGFPLAEGIEYDRRNELRLNDLSRLGDGLERTEGAGSLDRTDGPGSLERTDGADWLIDVSGRLNESLVTRLGLIGRLGLTGRLGLIDGLGAVGLAGMGLRLIALLLGELGLGAGLNDCDELGTPRLMVGGRCDICGAGDALGTGLLLALGREA